MTADQGRTEHPGPPDISGVGGWNVGSSGVGFSTFSTFDSILSLFMSEIRIF